MTCAVGLADGTGLGAPAGGVLDVPCCATAFVAVTGVMVTFVTFVVEMPFVCEWAAALRRHIKLAGCTRG